MFSEAGIIHAMDQTVISYFSRLATEHGATSHGVGMTLRSQIRRFETIMKIGDLEGKTLLDVGCGFGDFFTFLQDKGIRVDYTGFDITPVMIETAREKHPEVADRFHLVNILTEEISDRYNFVVSNGPLNVAGEGNLLLMQRLMRKMFEICTIGTVVTMTSLLTKRPSEGIFYYDPAEILRHAGTFCQNFVLDHSYLPHDFALFCYKKSLYD
jgi:SAM-dependent methyltransferase